MPLERKYSIDFKKRVVIAVDSAASISAVAKKYGIPPQTISRWVRLAEDGRLGLHPDDYGDRRMLSYCIHCFGDPNTKDHNPSRVFLDEPYPDDLPVVGVCGPCNSSFSVAEPYLACLIDAARTGSASPNEGWREKTKVVLAHNKKLRRVLAEAKREVDGNLYWDVDHSRAQLVINKLAKGHAAFELHDAPDCTPSLLNVFPLHTLNEEQRKHFETPPDFPGYPEVGSRALHRMFEDFPSQDPSGWIIIQHRRYRYVAAGSGNVAIVRMVFSEYLAAEVIWNDGEPLENSD